MRENETQDLFSYASAMINALRLQRDNERHSHSRTRDIANNRITLLEAQVARRDAEIAAAVSGDRSTPAAGSLPGVGLLNTPEPLDAQAMVKMLEWTATKNRQLEVDIHVLTGKVRPLS